MWHASIVSPRDSQLDVDYKHCDKQQTDVKWKGDSTLQEEEESRRVKPEVVTDFNSKTYQTLLSEEIAQAQELLVQVESSW